MENKVALRASAKDNMEAHLVSLRCQKGAEPTFYNQLIYNFSGFLDDSDVDGADLVEWFGEYLAESDKTSHLYNEITGQFPGFRNDSEVNGSDLIDWVSQNIERLKNIEIAPDAESDDSSSYPAPR